MRAWLAVLVAVGVGTAAGMQWWQGRSAAQSAGSPESGDPEFVVLAEDGSASENDSPESILEFPSEVLSLDEEADGASQAAPLAAFDPSAAAGAAEHDVDRPGGSRVEPEAETRKQAEILVAKATASSNPIEQARLLTEALRGNALDAPGDRKAYELLLEANRRGVLNPRVDDLCIRTTVKPRDTLWDICKRLQKESQIRVTPGVIRLVNHLTSDTIYPGAALKVPTVPVTILVEKCRFRLSVYLGDILLKRFEVGLGKDNRTPEGDFTIATREKDPTWFKPGVGAVPPESQENILGTRWLGFAAKDGFPEAATFGIHGTRDDSSIGKEASNGCVRMRNPEVEEIFEWIGEGTAVVIRA